MSEESKELDGKAPPFSDQRNVRYEPDSNQNP